MSPFYTLFVPATVLFFQSTHFFAPKQPSAPTIALKIREKNATIDTPTGDSTPARAQTSSKAAKETKFSAHLRRKRLPPSADTVRDPSSPRSHSAGAKPAPNPMLPGTKSRGVASHVNRRPPQVLCRWPHGRRAIGGGGGLRRIFRRGGGVGSGGLGKAQASSGGFEMRFNSTCKRLHLFAPPFSSNSRSCHSIELDFLTSIPIPSPHSFFARPWCATSSVAGSLPRGLAACHVA